VAAEARATAEVAAELGLETIGLWPGADAAGAAWEGFVAGVRTVVEAVAPTGVGIAIEYKPGTALPSAAEALACCDAVAGVSVLVDTGHAYAAVEDSAAVVARVGHRLGHVHLGASTEGSADDDQPVGRLHDFAPFVAALDAGAYRGAASLDLYGAVCAGVATGKEAAAESRNHLLSHGCSVVR
jgi:sugar phosphate isomerase/epimerase